MRSSLYKGILRLQYRLSESFAKLACSQGLDNAITLAKLERLTWYGSHPCLDDLELDISLTHWDRVTLWVIIGWDNVMSPACQQAVS